MDKTTEKFVTYAAKLRYCDLTQPAVHAVKRSLVDAIGCALGAFRAEPAKAIRRVAARVTSTTPATVFGTPIKTSPEWAAIANGAMVRYLDFSDDYFGGAGDTGPHPSDNIGGVLAAAEATGVDGQTAILGIALAYEACGQLVDHATIRVNGWDHPIYHSIASALGAGKVMGLSSDQLANAVGLAVVANICLRETRTGHISNWKGFAGPNGSRSGVYSALLAQEGITGPPKPFEGRAGFMKQLNTPFELGALGGGGIPFKVEGTFFKYIPVRYEIQLPILVALEIRQRISLSDVVTIRVHVEKKNALDRTQSPEPWNPTSRETADHSGPYLIGAALVDGGISEKTFTAQRYRAPEIIDLIQKISLVEDPQYTAAFPRAFNCRFEVLLKSGEVVTVHRTNPKGHPANPMSDQELEAKFLKQVENIIPSQQSRKLLDTLWTLERLNRISELFPLMVVPETA